jgi:hypothetical protein
MKIIHISTLYFWLVRRNHSPNDIIEFASKEYKRISDPGSEFYMFLSGWQRHRLPIIEFLKKYKV